MVDIEILTLKNDSGELKYYGERPPVIKLYYLSREYIPVCSNDRLDLYTEAYSLEDGTFAYLSEYNRIDGEFDSHYSILRKELETLHGQKSSADAAVTQAKNDLAALPNRKSSYISSRTSYYMGVGVGGSQYAIELANRDWELYYSLVKSNLNKTITSENAHSRELSDQINAKQSELDILTRNYNNAISELKQRFPDARNGIIGGTYKADHFMD